MTCFRFFMSGNCSLFVSENRIVRPAAAGGPSFSDVFHFFAQEKCNLGATVAGAHFDLFRFFASRNHVVEAAAGGRPCISDLFSLFHERKLYSGSSHYR